MPNWQNSCVTPKTASGHAVSRHHLQRHRWCWCECECAASCVVSLAVVVTALSWCRLHLPVSTSLSGTGNQILATPSAPASEGRIGTAKATPIASDAEGVAPAVDGGASTSMCSCLTLSYYKPVRPTACACCRRPGERERLHLYSIAVANIPAAMLHALKHRSHANGCQ